MYLSTVFIIYFLFFVLESFFPRKKWVIFRKIFVLDIIFVIINTYLFWTIEWNIYGLIEKYFCVSVHISPLHISESSLWIQAVILFFLFDFLRWATHRMLHSTRIGWKIHKTHHTISNLHFLKVFYYNPLENLVYMVTTVPILFLFHFSFEVFIILGAIDLVMGCWNHANTSFRVPHFLARIINTPQVHIWHHDESHKKGSRKNFGINLSLWDWVFGTLYIDEKDPKEIGNVGDRTRIERVFY